MAATMSLTKKTLKSDQVEQERLTSAIRMKVRTLLMESELSGLDLENDDVYLERCDTDPKKYYLTCDGDAGEMTDEQDVKLMNFLLDVYLRTGTLVYY